MLPEGFRIEPIWKWYNVYQIGSYKLYIPLSIINHLADGGDLLSLKKP